MPIAPFPYTVDGKQGDVPNGFYPAADSDREVLLLPTPGLKEICTLTDCTEIREVYSWGNFIYALARRGSQTVLWRVDASGGFAELGTITTSASGPAWMKNNPTQLGSCDGVSLYIYTPGTGLFVQNTDPAFVGAGGFDYQDTYGMYFQPGTRNWFVTNQDQFLSQDSTQQYVKQTQPDNIVALLSFMRQPLIAGAKTMEWYHNTGGTDTSGAAATFERDAGGLMNYGCGAPKSLVDLCGAAPAWLSDQGEVLMAGGYTVIPFSNQMFTRAVRGDGTTENPGYSTFADAIAFAYRDKGHVFYQITFPSAGVTWVYDLTTKMWHKRQSYLEDGSGWGRHRANCYTLLGNKHYVGDYLNGKIYEMSNAYFDDNSQEIQRILYSRFLDSGRKLTYYGPLQLLLEPGIGLTGGADPQVMLEITSNGKTWSSEIWRSAGAIGNYDARIIWEQLGADFRRQYRFTMSDSVDWTIYAMDLGVA